MKHVLLATFAAGCFVCVGLVAVHGAEAEVPSLVGAWTLNKDLSDQPNERQPDGQQRSRRGGEGGDSGGRGGRGGRGGGFGGGGGGFGGGRGGGRGGFGGGRGNPEDNRRKMDALRDIMAAPERMTITQTDSLVIVTAGDGRTTRLAPTGKKIKDESTGIERKTKWDDGKLVTDITGAGPGTITETYAVNADTHQLDVTLHVDNQRAPNGGMIHRVYDLDTPMKAGLIVFLVVGAAGCGSGGTSTTAPSTPTPTVAVTTDTFSGTVSVGGSDAHTFTVALTNGNLNVTLTAAGPPPTIFMGIGIGVPSGSTCTLYANAFTTAQASTTAQLSFSGVPAGDYCVMVYDLGNQAADVAYTVTASHY